MFNKALTKQSISEALFSYMGWGILIDSCSLIVVEMGSILNITISIYQLE